MKSKEHYPALFAVCFAFSFFNPHKSRNGKKFDVTLLNNFIHIIYPSWLYCEISGTEDGNKNYMWKTINCHLVELCFEEILLE